MILKVRQWMRQKIRLTNSSRNWHNKNNRCVASITLNNVIRAALKRLGEWMVSNDTIDVVVAVVRIGVIVTILAMLASCSATWHLKRAIAKDPTIANDTIIRVDTSVVTESIRAVDTLVVTDTVVREIVREGVQIKLQRIHDTIRVDVVCPPDTVRVVANVPVERIIYEQKPLPLYRRAINIMYLILAIIVLAWVYRLTK